MSPDSMTSGWHHAKVGAPVEEETGPLSWEELYLLARAGTVAPEDLVWNPELPCRVAAGQVPGLFAPSLIQEQRPVRTAPDISPAEPGIPKAEEVPSRPEPIPPIEAHEEAARETAERRPLYRVAAPLVLMVIGVFLLVVALVERDTVMGENATIAVAVTTATTATMAGGPVEEDILTHPIPNPDRLEIPAIELSAKIVPVGLHRNGEMSIPRGGRVGWYKFGPAPGNQGPVVMVGHYDAARDPAVFYRVKDLRPGDEIRVYGEDGDMAAYEVDRIERWLKADLPTERIWDYTPEAVIRLVTCGGEYDRRTHHYLSNVIAYGHLVR